MASTNRFGANPQESLADEDSVLSYGSLPSLSERYASSSDEDSVDSDLVREYSHDMSAAIAERRLLEREHLFAAELMVGGNVVHPHSLRVGSVQPNADADSISRDFRWRGSALRIYSDASAIGAGHVHRSSRVDMFAAACVQYGLNPSSRGMRSVWYADDTINHRLVADTNFRASPWNGWSDFFSEFLTHLCGRNILSHVDGKVHRLVAMFAGFSAVSPLDDTHALLDNLEIVD